MRAGTLFFILLLATVTVSAADNLFVLNKFAVTVDGVSSPDCASNSLTPNAQVYCAFQKASLALVGESNLARYTQESEGFNPATARVAVQVYVAPDALQSVSQTTKPFSIPSLTEDRQPLSTQSLYAFSKAGTGYNAIFLDFVNGYPSLYVYASESGFPVARVLVAYLADESQKLPSLSSGCEILVSKDARAIAFKGCTLAEQAASASRVNPDDFKTLKISSTITQSAVQSFLYSAEKVANQYSQLSFASNVLSTSSNLQCEGESVDPSRGYYIEVYKQQPQRLFLYNDNQLVTSPYNFPIIVSTGLNPGDKQVQGDKKTPIGTYCLTNKVPNDPGSAEFVKYGPANFKIGQKWGYQYGIELHGTPQGQENLLGQPASLGSVRTPNSVMGWMYREIPVGTPITIYDESVSPPTSGRQARANVQPAEPPAPVKEGKSGIRKVTNLPSSGECPIDENAVEAYSGGEYACVYYAIDQADGQKDKFFDVAFAAYGALKNGGSCTMARYAISRQGVTYPDGYKALPDVAVHEGQFPEADNYVGKYVTKIRLKKNNEDGPTGFYLRMFFSENQGVFSTYDDERGIARRAVGPVEKIAVPDCERQKPTGGRDLPAGTPFRELILNYAAQNGLDPFLVRNVIRAESSDNPNAYNKKSGASGLMQVLPSTAQSECGVSGPQLFDPETSISCGTRYLKKMYEMFKEKRSDELERIKLALAGYNWGPGNMQTALRNNPAAPSYPSETQKYISQILADYSLPSSAYASASSGDVPAVSCAKFSNDPIQGYWSVIPGGRNGARRAYAGGHTGFDYGGRDIGTPVVSVWPGKILYQTFKSGYGNELAILTKCLDGSERVVLYDHLQGFNTQLKPGTIVQANQLVAYLGNTGGDYDAHLHIDVLSGPFTITSNNVIGKVNNPENYIANLGQHLA